MLQKSNNNKDILDQLPPNGRSLVGGYRIGDAIFSTYNKPNWFHRFMLKLLMGIMWVDY